MVELGQAPLERVLGPEVGSFYRDLHSDHGVELHFGAETEALVGARSVEGVSLADGRMLPADVVVVGVGVVPTTELAESSGHRGTERRRY